MNKNIELLAINKLKKYNQDNIIELIHKLSNEEKENIYKQIINLDFEKINTLYDELIKKEKININNIQNVVALNKDKLSKDDLEKYKKYGEQIIKNNQYALVTMSGGQGTRLGFDKPKGEFLINIFPKPMFLFEILVEKLKKENDKYNVIIPWYIMTSSENDKEIKNFFIEHNYFGYNKNYIYFFMQDNIPLLTENKKLIIGEDKLIKEAADGNGGIFSSMNKSKALDDMKKRNIKWTFISSIDNILLNIADTVLIGLAEERNVDVATKSLLRNSPEEKVGTICKIDNKIKVIEYTEMSDEMKNKQNDDGELIYGESHIMCNLFSINALEKLVDKQFPYHIAHKKASYLDNNGNIIKPCKPNAYKFETFIFDAWEYFNDIAILRGKREEDFAPIKNKEGVDSPQTAIELYNNYIKNKI